jgi:hypothetical protein
MSDEYQIIFAVDGNMSVLANSPEDAEAAAVDVLQCLDSMDAEYFQVEGCTIRITARVTDDAHEKIEGRLQCIEFPS